MVEINHELCVGCGLCVRDCPEKVICIEEKKAQISRACIQCGHCVAICPVKAVAIPEYEMEDVEEYVSENYKVDMQNLLHAIKFRRSIRNFKEQPIEREKLVRILEAGRYTPTAKNRQACTFVVVQERIEEFKRLVWEEIPDILEKIGDGTSSSGEMIRKFYERWRENFKNDSLFFNSKTFLAVATEVTTDGALAAANIENMTVAAGGGVLHSGFLVQIISNSEKLREWLGLNKKPVACCMLLGYPAVSYKRTAPRKKADIIWK